MTAKTGQIDGYLKDRNKAIYREALLYLVNDASEHDYAKSISHQWYRLFYCFNADDGIDAYTFCERLFDLFDDNTQLSEFVLWKQWNGLSLFQTLWKSSWVAGAVEALRYILFNKRIESDADKCKSLAHYFAIDSEIDNAIVNRFNKTLQALRNGANDVKLLDTFSMIFDLYKHNDQVVFQHKPFNYFTLKTAANDETEFKVIDDDATEFNGCGLRSFGYENDGALGVGEIKKSTWYPQMCTALSKKKIIKISAYYEHMLCVDSNGFAYSCGSNWVGQLGLGDCEKRIVPQIVNTLKSYNAVSVAAGKYHSLILTDEGNVWSFGYGNDGQLGYVTKEKILAKKAMREVALSPNIIDSLNNEHIVNISCGACHSCVISKDGKLFTFGYNGLKQCGVEHLRGDRIFVPTNVVLPNELTPAFIECGNCHTLILTTNHMVLSCGKGEEGQLGHGNDDIHCNTPKIIDALKTKHIINIAAGHKHSLCVSKDGEVYAFGIGTMGVLGHGDIYPQPQMEPAAILFFKDKNIKIRECAAGGESHSGAISITGEVYLWGSGRDGCLGIGSRKVKAVPTKVEYFNNIKAKCLALGDKCSFVISDSIDLKGNQSEEKEEDVEKEWILKGDKEMNIKNAKALNVRSKPFVVFVRNRLLFGDLNWVLWKRRSYFSYPFYTELFMNSLQVTNDGTIELIDVDSIDKQYHEEILKATYLLLVNEEKSEIKKQ
eukprot:123481_1